MGALDFSHITTLEDVRRLEKDGKLVGICLFPTEFGGEEIQHNVVYVTPEAAEARSLIVGTLMRLVGEGTINRMTVEPSYRGESVVPVEIRIDARHDIKAGRFQPVITVW